MKNEAFIAPITTEKTAKAQEKGIYTFLVRGDVNKLDVKQAFEKMYGEKVEKVQMSYIKPKKRAYGKQMIEKRKRLKKAVLTLHKNKKIDLFSFEKIKPDKE